nr:hypothetical protein [Allomuricauda sp.]
MTGIRSMAMFYSKGMNFVDLAQFKVEDIFNERLSYGRSKTDEPLSVKITVGPKSILDYHLNGKTAEGLSFPD